MAERLQRDVDLAPQARCVDRRMAPRLADAREFPGRAACANIRQEKLAEDFEWEPANGRNERLVVCYFIPFVVSSDARGK